MNTQPDQKTFSDAEQAELRDRVAAILETEGLTKTALAEESGIAYGTFTGWLGSTYAGNNDSVAGKVVLWLESRVEKRQAAMRVARAPEFVRTKSAAHFMEVLRYAQVLPDITVIVGNAGIGKTTAARRYRDTNPNVILVTMHPSAGTVYPMLGAIAEAAKVQEKVMTRLFGKIGDKLGDRGALLIIDEAQHLDTRALEQLRAFYDIYGIGIAIVGNDIVLGRIQGGGKGAEFAQLFSRVGFKVTQKEPKGDDICELLKAWGITDKDQLRFLKAIAQKAGALRVMTKTLQLASIMASQESGGLQLAHIKTAYSQIDIPAQAG